MIYWKGRLDFFIIYKLISFIVKTLCFLFLFMILSSLIRGYKYFEEITNILQKKKKKKQKKKKKKKKQKKKKKKKQKKKKKKKMEGRFELFVWTLFIILFLLSLKYFVCFLFFCWLNFVYLFICFCVFIHFCLFIVFVYLSMLIRLFFFN